MAKPFWTSKTFWVNGLALVAIILQAQFGFVLDLETQATILAAINILLRFVTGVPVAWK